MEKQCKRMQKMKEKNPLFLRHHRGAGNIQVKDGKGAKSNKYGENLLKMRERNRKGSELKRKGDLKSY